MVSQPGRLIDRLTAGAHARIDLDAYASNVRALMGLAPSGAAFMAVVKADAYGHGAAFCAAEAVSAGAEWLGVARIHEGVHLRGMGISAPILVLGPPNLLEIEQALLHGITLTVGTRASVDAIAETARRMNRRAAVHLKIDTGMHRYGVLPEDSLSAAGEILGSSVLDLDGVFTHFSSADEIDPTPTRIQIERFDAVIEQLRAEGIAPRFVHLANSAAVLSGRAGQSNLVRCGIASYGLSPSDEVSVPGRLRPVMSIHATVSRTFEVTPGEGVSYGLTWRASSHERLATIPIGYADGLPRRLSNQGWFVINGQRCPIRGRVCMDQTVVEAPSANEGDPVIVVGDGQGGSMTLDAVARMADTINYEVATRLTARVPRIYVRGGEPVAWEHLLTGQRGRVT